MLQGDQGVWKHLKAMNQFMETMRGMMDSQSLEKWTVGGLPCLWPIKVSARADPGNDTKDQGWPRHWFAQLQSDPCHATEQCDAMVNGDPSGKRPIYFNDKQWFKDRPTCSLQLFHICCRICWIDMFQIMTEHYGWLSGGFQDDLHFNQNNPLLRKAYQCFNVFHDSQDDIYSLMLHFPYFPLSCLVYFPIFNGELIGLSQNSKTSIEHQ